MTEREKIEQGLLYKPWDPELAALCRYARKKVKEYNEMDPDDQEGQKALLRDLLGKTGRDFHIEAPIRFDYGCNIEIGENFYANYNWTVLDSAKVRIGDNVMLAPNVSFYCAGHPIHYEIRNLGPEYAFPITIGDNVWIGGSVTVCPGVTIGENSVIGAGSVVTKDIPPNCVAAGNPCKVIRPITEEDKLYYYKKRPL